MEQTQAFELFLFFLGGGRREEELWGSGGEVMGSICCFLHWVFVAASRSKGPWRDRYSMNSDVNPIPGIGGFITIFVGCVIFVFVKVKDIVKEGFTIARVYEYIDKVGDQAMDIFPKFRMNKGEHAFFPTGVIPVAIGMAPKVEPQTSEVVSYVINYVFGSTCLAIS